MGPVSLFGATIFAAAVFAVRRAEEPMDPGWPNILTALVLGVVLGSAAVAFVVLRRARASLSDGRRRRQ